MDIAAIYRRAWELTKKYKALWFFGAIVATFAGGGSSFNSNFSNWSSGESGEGDSRGDYQEALSRLGEQVANLFSQIPPHVWLLLFLGILAAVALGIFISWVARAWAVGSLIGGVEQALDDKEVTVSEVAKRGFKSFRSLFWLTVIPGLLFGLVVLAGLTAVVLVGALTQIWWLAVVLGLPLGVAIVIGLVIIAAIQVWAQRLAVIEGKSGRESFKEGWAMTKKYFGETLLLGFINFLLSCCVGCLAWLVILPVVFVVAVIIIGLAAVSPALAAGVGLTVGLVAICLLSLAIFLYGAYYTFNYSTWNILYREIKNKR